MPRDTSAEAYAAIRESGYLGQTLWAVYDCLYRFGGRYGDGQGLSQTECYHTAIDKGLVEADKKDSLGPRFAPLERMGIIQRVAKRQCHYTERTVWCYDATSFVPTSEQVAEALRRPRTFWAVLGKGERAGVLWLDKKEAKEDLRQTSAELPGSEMFEVTERV